MRPDAICGELELECLPNPLNPEATSSSLQESREGVDAFIMGPPIPSFFNALEDGGVASPSGIPFLAARFLSSEKPFPVLVPASGVFRPGAGLLDLLPILCRFS